MTIHHIINDYNLSLGGAQKVALNLHIESLNRGLSSKIFGLSRNPLCETKNAYSLNYSSPYRLVILLKIWRYFRKEVNKGDVIHVHLFPASLYIAILKISKLIPKCTFVMTEHNTTNRRRKLLIGKLADSLMYRSYDNIIAISKGTSNSLKQYKPYLKSKLKIIKNGVNLFYKEPIKRIQKKEIIILSVGRLHKQKNYELALNVIAKITGSNIKYWIAGEGELKKPLNQQIKRLGLQDKVKLLGYVSDIPALLKDADIFFMPSKWEGFGLAALEAMNASLPSVVSNVEGLKDVFYKDGEDVFFVSPNDEKNMELKLNKLITNQTLRTKMGEKAFSQSLNFGLTEMANNYIHLYNSI